MRKKQLLATLVMLSLMQGSVYAADKITEKDFDSSNTYTAQTSDVGPIYIIDNKEKDYTINAPDGLNIVDVEHRGIIVSTENSNDNASMSSLTINGNVQIGNNSGVQIVPENELLGYRTSTALVQVGQSTYNGGKLTINGNLNIQNVDFSNVNSLISVSGADGKKNASELNIGSITIDNVTGGNKGIIYTDNKPEVSLAGNSVILDVGDIIVTNSDAGFLIDDGTSYTSILKTGNITLQNVDFTNSAMYLTNLETEGKIIYKSTDEMNLATYGDEFLFYFQPNNNDVISISDGIEIENVKGTYTGWNESGTFYYSGFSSKNSEDVSSHLAVPYIKVNNLELEYTGSNSVYAVALKSGGTFSVDEITVDKVLFSGIGNFNIAAGIAIESPDTEQVINYISATNITANATSSTGHFDGIFLNNSKLKEGVNGINVANIHADNVKTYGLNVTEQDLNSNSINIEKVSSIKEDTYGMQIRSGNDSTKSGSNIGTVNIKNVTSQNKSAYGFYLNKYSNNIYNNDAIANINNLTVNGVSGSDDYCTIDVNATNDGTILNVENAYINNENATGYNGAFADKADENKEKMNDIALCVVDGAVANWDNEEGTYYLNGTIVAGAGKNNSDNGGKINISGNDVNIFGDVFAGNGGEVNITLNANNVLEGQVDDYHEINEDNNLVFHNSAFVNSSGAAVDVTSAGTATLNINDGGKWIARGQSFVDTISLDGGIIDMSKNENSSVTVENLKGEGGQFIMRLDTGNHTNSDMLYVTGTFEGNHELIIDSDEFVASEITENNPLRFATIKGDVNVENMKARVTDAGFFNNTYNITKEQFDDMDTDNVTYNGSGNGQGSYKPGNDVVTSTFDEDDVNLLITAEGKQSQISDAGQTIINMSRANYSNAIYMDRLNKRMGEARYISPEDEQGMWVRLRHDRIGKEDAFRSQNTMYEMGYDVKQDCDNGDRRVGFAIDYMDGKTEYRNVAGDGDIKRYGLWLYDTWMGDKGHYADYVLKWGHLENDFDIYNSRGKVNGDYSNNVFSVSAEYGKKNDMGNDWYFEPQAQLQLARVSGADYVTSQNTKVSLDGINSLIGRAGFRLGKDMGERSTVYVKADVLHEFLGDQTISALDTTTNGTYRETFENKGTWYDVGFGFATALGKDSYAFMDFEKSFGNDNDETY